MALKHLVLARLMRGPAHGYEMHHEPMQPLHPDFGVTEAHIYASLRSLQKDGYVRHRRTRRKPYPERIRYAITPKGKTYLRVWAGSPDPEPQAPLARALWDPLAMRQYVTASLKNRRVVVPRSATALTRQRIVAYAALLRSKSFRTSGMRALLMAGLGLERAQLSWLKLHSGEGTRRGKKNRGRSR